MAKQPPTLIFIPTYNEADNAERIFRKISDLNLNVDLLFIDDNSPDGTGSVIDRIADKNENVFAVHRKGKLGIGSAHKDGINWAYDHGYTLLVTMDCDFTHCPSYIPEFICKAERAEIVVGSRYLKEDSLRQWNFFRKFLTRLGHFLTNWFLSLPYDATGSFRSYRLDQIPRELFGRVRSNGYSFFFESLLILNLSSFAIKEIPLHLFGRSYGHSKMRLSDIFQSLSRLFKLFAIKVFHKKSLCFILPENEATKQSLASVQNEWDAYWNRQQSLSSIIYGSIASIYKNLFIRPNLKRFIDKHFSPNAKLLHTGYGSGQTDTWLYSKYNVLALDISGKAIEPYKSIHTGKGKVLQGSILDLPIRDNSFDGVFNLGVVEHFNIQEIERFFSESCRVLVLGGKLIIFWPPTFGLSVKVLGVAYYILNKWFNKNIKLHPDEISLLKSREQAREFVEKAGFKMIDYYFGPRDLFIQVVVVAERI